MSDFIRDNPGFIGNYRKTAFGSLVFHSIDYMGETDGNWYSVDTDGRVRTHSISTAGVYVAARNSKSSSMRSKTRASRGTSS